MRKILPTLLLITLHSFFPSYTEAQRYSIHRLTQFDFIARWRDSGKTIYTGNSLNELLEMCPDGCGGNCSSFPVYAPPDVNGNVLPPALEPCTENDIKVLKKAQELGQGWKKIQERVPDEILLHSSMLLIIILLIIVLMIRGHYRIRDLWFVSSDRLWELENDPTWGLPGKVWALLQIRVVKSDKEDSKPTDRKYSSYTENPITLGEKFWYYKQALRDMYKTHKYYKRNRYFHKLAWQVIKLGKIIPETLRRQAGNKRRAGELEEQRSNGSSDEVTNPQGNTPWDWEIDLADEVNLDMLRDAKEKVQEEIDKAKEDGHFINGRVQNLHQHHHHHHHPHQIVFPLTKQEVQNSARQLEVDPNAECVNVDGVMRRNPLATKSTEKIHRHRHHHRHHKKSKQ